MRFLCLHGAGTNAEILESQTSGLRYELRNDGHTFEFIEASHSCEAAPGVKQMYPADTEYFQFCDEVRPETLLTAINDVHELLREEEEPFDAVLGFSQGAMIAANVLIDQAKDPKRSPPLKCGVFICVGRPIYDLVEQRAYDPEVDGDSMIRIPTYHAFGRQDDFYPLGVTLSRLCTPTLKETYDHRGHHEIPRNVEVSKAMAEGIRRCVQRASAAA